MAPVLEQSSLRNSTDVQLRVLGALLIREMLKGGDVTEFAIGDEVYYTPQIFGGPGSYAQQHVANVDLVARKPRNISHLEAASLTLVGGTVWEALVSRAQLAVHETILIHGGSGGVGTIAIQLAKAIGARVITTAHPSNHEFVRMLGADEVIDYTTDDYVTAVADPNGEGAAQWLSVTSPPTIYLHIGATPRTERLAPVEEKAKAAAMAGAITAWTASPAE